MIAVFSCKGKQPDNPKEAAYEGNSGKNVPIVREQVPGKVSLSPEYRAVTISSSCNFYFIYSDVLRQSPSVAQVILKLTMQPWLASDSEQILLPQLPSWSNCRSIQLCLFSFAYLFF